MSIVIDTINQLEDNSILIRVTKKYLLKRNKTDIVIVRIIDGKCIFYYPIDIRLSERDKLLITMECCSYLEHKSTYNKG